MRHGYGSMRKASAIYQQYSVWGRVEGADRHQLNVMLFDGLADRINQARGHILHGEVRAKGEACSKAVAILGQLRASLDHDLHLELTKRLEALYEYMTRRLLHAQLHDDVDALDECLRLLTPLREAWQSIRPAYLDQAQEGRA